MRKQQIDILQSTLIAVVMVGLAITTTVFNWRAEANAERVTALSNQVTALEAQVNTSPAAPSVTK